MSPARREASTSGSSTEQVVASATTLSAGRIGTIDQLLSAKEIAITCGSGGVGKTTTAAALAVMAAVHHGGRVLVLTVDPAKRLANALGLAAFGNDETEVPLAALAAGAGIRPKGKLVAAMLDTKQSWDDLVRLHAPDATTAQRILANPLYDNITGRFVQSHDYIAMERLYELHSSGRYDLVVVDTPPSRNALDFLDAPARMAEFFGSRLLRWLTMPYRSRLVTFASKPFTQVADRILGSQFLGDIAEFFTLLQSMESGFVTRANEVGRILADRRTTFVVVSTLEASPAHEAAFLIDELGRRSLHLGALVLNKVLPSTLLDPAAQRAAAALDERAEILAAELAPLAGADPAQVGRVLVELARSFHDLRLAAGREAEQRLELGAIPEVTVSVPYLAGDVHDLNGLLAIGSRLWQ